MPTRIDTAHLRALGACEEQVARFDATFPEGITITPDNAEAVAEAAAEAWLDIYWYAERALTPEEWAAYEKAGATARAAYEEAEATALAAYEEATTTAWAVRREAEAQALTHYESGFISYRVYFNACKEADDACDAAIRPARDAYNTVLVAAVAAYRAASAPTLARILAARLLGKDGYMNLRGKWLYEIAELEALKRAEAVTSKAWLSNRVDTYRS